MASGFLEPLDAPGLDQTVNYLTQISHYLDLAPQQRLASLADINQQSEKKTQWFSAFILSQYKTADRNDTDFWRDQKSVNCHWYEEIINSISDISRVQRNTQAMFYVTMAGKDCQWPVGEDLESIPLMPVKEEIKPTLHHWDFISSIRSTNKDNKSKNDH
jgi:hypothetical protein